MLSFSWRLLTLSVSIDSTETSEEREREIKTRGREMREIYFTYADFSTSGPLVPNTLNERFYRKCKKFNEKSWLPIFFLQKINNFEFYWTGNWKSQTLCRSLFCQSRKNSNVRFLWKFHEMKKSARRKRFENTFSKIQLVFFFFSSICQYLITISNCSPEFDDKVKSWGFFVAIFRQHKL